MILSFLGGTGPEGLGLAARFARAGQEVILGSRSEERAQEAAAKIRALVPGAQAQGMKNMQAAAQGEVVFVTIPYQGLRETLSRIADAVDGRIVVSTVVPLRFEKGRPCAVPVAEGSAAQEAQALLPQARVAGAFQNLSAGKLLLVEKTLPADVVVCADDAQAKETVMGLAALIAGVRPLDGGPLANSRYVEELTVLLIALNRRYKTETTLRIEGIP